MPRSLVGDIPMTGAERQARYRAARMSDAPLIRIRRPTDRRSRIQRWNDTIAALTDLQAEYAAWLEALCRTISERAPRPRPCGRLSISISQSFKRSNRRAVSAVIEQRDGPDGMGRDDAQGGLPASAGDRLNRASMPG